MSPKQLCEAVGFFDEQMRYVEDLDMWARMSRHGSILKINQALTGFRVHGAVQSMHTELNLRYHKLVLNKLFATIPELQQHQRWRRLAEARMYVHVSWMRHSAGDRWGALADILRSARSCQPLRSGKGQDLRWQRVKLLTHYLTHKAGS